MPPPRPRYRRVLPVLLAGFAFSTTAQGQTIQSQRIVTGLYRPVQITSPPGDFQRLFVIEQHSGKVLIIRDGAVLGTPFLTVGSLSTANEQGLLGIAFHPHYTQNGKFYVSYTRSDWTSEVTEYCVSLNPDVANPATRRVLLSQPQPFDNHNGGQIHFGPDGYLYLGLGDGGSGGDPNNNAQTDGTWLGKMLRIDVNGQDPGKQYRVPPTNPHVGPGNPLDEIWGKGLRNPWRFSFDRLTGDLYIGDVGQEVWEEIDYQGSGAAGGQNYGWKIREGDHCYPPSTPTCTSAGLVPPIFEYRHSSDPNSYGCPSALSGCSVTGGFVYRGRAVPEMQGRYFFADYCSNRVHSFLPVGGAATNCQEHTSALSFGGALNAITSFGEDAYGELYICDAGNRTAGQGEIYKIVRNPPLPDADSDGVPDGTDNCVNLANPGQENNDNDGAGDVCDTDDDNDSAPDATDNCVLVSNNNQDDADGDDVGDVCDACPGTSSGAVVDAAGCALPIRGDFDGDGDVDQSDFGWLQQCFSGPGTAASVECAASKLDADSDVDQADFNLFAVCISGPNMPAPTQCAYTPPPVAPCAVIP